MSDRLSQAPSYGNASSPSLKTRKPRSPKASGPSWSAVGVGVSAPGMVRNREQLARVPIVTQNMARKQSPHAIISRSFGIQISFVFVRRPFDRSLSRRFAKGTNAKLSLKNEPANENGWLFNVVNQTTNCKAPPLYFRVTCATLVLPLGRFRPRKLGAAGGRRRLSFSPGGCLADLRASAKRRLCRL